MGDKREELKKDAFKVSILKYRISGEMNRFCIGSDGKELSLTFIYSVPHAVLGTLHTSSHLLSMRK